MVRQRMAEHNFQGEIIVQELIAEHLAAVEKLVDTPPTTEAVPEELVVEAPAAETAPAAGEAPAETPWPTLKSRPLRSSSLPPKHLRRQNQRKPAKSRLADWRCLNCL
jgi:hypothetical protein